MVSKAAGLRYKGRDDLLLMVFDNPAQVAGVFTKSACPSAPVDWCKEHLSAGVARALLVNAGNANAFTGRLGVKAATESATHAAKAVGCKPSEVFLASTGVIGEPLDTGPIADHLPAMMAELSADGWHRAAGTIMTTDTYAKVSTLQATLAGRVVTINGIAKGSGMIAPDMATMLSFIVTDAPVSASVLQSFLATSVETTFNAITVDSDTSTSDTVLAFATGTGDLYEDADSADLAEFRDAFHAVMRDLAVQVVRDGEGASKQLAITVRGAESDFSARKIAMAVANSPLVKTAVAGEDANWGRVVMAVGKAGEAADRDRLAIWFGDVRVAAEGQRVPDYSEELASQHMKGSEIELTVDVGVGTGTFTVLTCDLTSKYVAINGDYRS